MRKISILFVFFSVTLTGQNFKESTIKQHISFLASDKLKGRGTSSPEEILAANYIATEFKKLGLTAYNNSYLRPYNFKKNPDPHDTSLVGIKEKSSNNVVGFLDNKAPYTIVIGAHYDHLGLGHDHNSLDPNPEGKIHNGADDNASGTVGVMELARYFSSNNKKEPFNFLFMCFSGEELGLLGSKKWCDKPDIDLLTINYMVNMDMIGRLNDSTKKIIVYGVGTSPVFVPLIDSIQTALSIKKDSSGIGPSDQTSFYLKDIPVLHFFTGQHSDYHKPSDDAEKINYKGEAEVLNYIVTIIEKTYNYPKLTFSKTRTPDTGKSSFKVTMGVMPDYTYEGEGMRIDGVTDNKPAFKAGIEKGDVVKKLGEDKVLDVMSYMKALSKYNKGDSTTVEILRGKETKVVNLTF
ncbi:M20/M25/M40 family metallo-hydrolase [Aurantibacillus circumpalustris]|uniref:M20/M25/M40 family metallo-hydrolase n=1 Tax=Aurantibacillus circumpalustris TaxID=3036359 RepID=UPI00295C0CF0|nr:M20/M25/M40 family metallo-hydrolase [Aurantibacillus circumpalustris]